jgi:inosine/xanthosine triphosphate pyrophosphatase family protein/dephospho-CoA kinase
MRDLTFFTTNATKLAHARYIAEGHQVRIKGFRQRTYHAGYTEPRLFSRSAILEASYDSARKQLIKAGFSEHRHPFVLEDTSVRIDALSTAERDVPGVDIKYWMQDQTFDELDAELRARANLRSAIVRSDVLLHVPRAFSSAWNVDTDYIVFMGEQHGKIVECEVNFETNLVFPWLDNRTFNKWFQPDGCDGPLGSLPIGTADKVDFRRKSFEKLFAFLKEHRYLSTEHVQMELPLESRPSIMLCGYTCAGKTTASQHLARKLGYLHVEASDFMHLSYFYRHGYRGRISIGDFAEEALTQKPTIAAEKVVEYLMEYLSEPIVISGFRASEEIAYVNENLSTQGKRFITRFIHANERARFERMRARARPGDDLTIEDFRGRDRQQERMGLERIKGEPGVELLTNDGVLGAYLAQIDQLTGATESDEINVSAGLGEVIRISEIGLEQAILIALLSVWKDNESREFYTTTEISRLIASVFRGAPMKHKDNVSRYFNQDYYAYYDISSEDGRTTRKYRLSNTGYGMAVRALRLALK